MIKMIVRIIPFSIKQSPFLKMVVLGKDIQKKDTTKNNKEIAKHIQKKQWVFKYQLV
jgi:hypothetical protein